MGVLITLVRVIMKMLMIMFLNKLSYTQNTMTVPASPHMILLSLFCRQKRQEVGEDILCAGVEDGSKDACQGDSGGALVSEQGGVYHLVGVVSAGLGCARRNVPGLYADVARHMDWIEGVLRL